MLDEQIIERHGEAFEFDQPLTILGRKSSLGETIPDGTLALFDPAAGAIHPVYLSDTASAVGCATWSIARYACLATLALPPPSMGAQFIH